MNLISRRSLLKLGAAMPLVPWPFKVSGGTVQTPIDPFSWNDVTWKFESRPGFVRRYETVVTYDRAEQPLTSIIEYCRKISGVKEPILCGVDSIRIAGDFRTKLVKIWIEFRHMEIVPV